MIVFTVELYRLQRAPWIYPYWSHLAMLDAEAIRISISNALLVNKSATVKCIPRD